MVMNYLDFEQPIAELQEKIEELRRVGAGSVINLSDEVSRLEDKRDSLIKSIFSKLTAQQIVQMARHPLRPYTLDYIERIFTDFTELHGDRHYGAGAPIVAGLARLNGESVMVVGHQKGRATQEKIKRNFGMARP
jgi:acetyl-CoA carboxylase carboxyl transferase subunit alpha